MTTLRQATEGDGWGFPLPLADFIEVVTVEVAGAPAVGFLIVHAALLEIHTLVKPGQGKHYAEALASLRAHLKATRPDAERLWTYVENDRLERVAMRYGFRPACKTKDGEIYMYMSLGGPN